jgi:hypothetical protein
MAQTALLFLAYYAAAGIVSYGTPRLLIALGVPLDMWIDRTAAAVSIHMTREASKWGMSLALGMALFGAATFYIARGIPIERHITDVPAGIYDAQLNDDVLDVISLPTTIILPTNFPRGKTILVKDGTGQANATPILIEADGDSKISGLSRVAINSNRGSWSFIWDGKEWSFY